MSEHLAESVKVLQVWVMWKNILMLKESLSKWPSEVKCKYLKMGTSLIKFYIVGPYRRLTENGLGLFAESALFSSKPIVPTVRHQN